MDDDFEIHEEGADGYGLVVVAGEVDVATAPALRDQLDGAIDRGTPWLVVDLSSVSFIDSTGLGVLIGASKRMEEDGGSLRLVVAEPRILKLFEITGLLDLFTIVPSRDQALPT